MNRKLGQQATPQERKRAMATLFLTIFISLIGFGIVIPLLPAYGEKMGATPWEIGWLFASFSLSQLVAGPILGDLSDRFGRRPVLIASLFGTAVSFVLLARAETLEMLFFARILDGLSGGNVSTARAYIADITAPEQRARSFGLIGVAFGLGFIIGPALGGLFFRIDLAAPAWLAASLALLATVMAFFWLPETVHQSEGPRPPLWSSLPIVLGQGSLAFLLLVDFLAWTCMSVYQTTFPLFANRRFGWTPDDIGLILAGVGFLGALVQGLLVGRLVRLLGEKKVLILGLTVGSSSLVLASLTLSPVLFVCLLVPAVAASGLISPSLIAMVSQASRADQQGRVQGVATALEGLGRSAGPVWGNGLLQSHGETAPYLSAGLVMMGTAMLSILLRPPRPAPPGPGISPETSPEGR